MYTTNSCVRVTEIFEENTDFKDAAFKNITNYVLDKKTKTANKCK